MISAQQALSTILEAIGPLGSVTVSIDRSLGYVIAEDIVAAEDIPPFDNAAMDGFAVKSVDVASAPATLNIVGDIGAGDIFTNELRRGEAVRIMTGAKIPAGSDAVIQQEWTMEDQPGCVAVSKSVSAGHNI